MTYSRYTISFVTIQGRILSKNFIKMTENARDYLDGVDIDWLID